MSDNPYERPSDRPQEGQGSNPPESYGPPSGASAYGPPAGEQNPYGQPDPNPYAQPSDQSPYGQPDPNPYGQPPTDPNLYGQPSDPNAYGQPAYGADAAPYGQPYGQGPYGGMPYGMAPQPHPQGTTVLVLGIIGLLVCFIPGIVAVVMGKRALREIDANPAAYNNRQNVQVGRILGIIGIVWQVLVILGYGAVVAALISSGSY